MFSVGNGFIVYNKKKSWKEGHTHLGDIKSAKCAIDYSLKKKIPKKATSRFIESLIRISNDEIYIDKLQDEISKWRR